MPEPAPFPPRSDAQARQRRYALSALALIFLGAGLRVLLAVTLPVGYDEVYVMGLGLDAMHASTAAALLDVPITRSTAVTPLWWWVQYLPTRVAGDVSLLALRLMPVLLGVATLVIAWYAACRSFGRRPALAFLAFLTFSDVLIFTNARGEFAESLFLPSVVLAVCAAGRAGRIVQRGALGAIVMLVALVKGIFFLGLMIGAECVLALVSRTRRLARLAGLGLALVIALLPPLAYLVWAHRHVAGAVIQHDAATAPGIAALVRALLFDYATIKAHVTGSLVDAAYLFLDFDVWPLAALTAPLLVCACVWGACRAIRDRLQPRSRRGCARLVLTLWTLVGAVVVIGRGTLGARFHLVYLPAAWMLAALWLTQRRSARRWPSTIAFSAFWSGYVGFAASWQDWGNGLHNPLRGALVGVGSLMVTLLLARLLRRDPQRAPGRAGLAAVLVALSAWGFSGPMSWAGISRFEPMPRGPELEILDAARSGRPLPDLPVPRTLYIDLANYFLAGAPDTPENRARGLHYARLEIRRKPDDPRAWFYVGEGILRTGGDPAQARDAWRRSLELRPNDQLAQRLARLESALESAPP